PSSWLCGPPSALFSSARPRLYLSLELTAQPLLASACDRQRADRHVPRGDAVGLEDDDVLGRLPALDLTRDHLLQLVHLEPVEHPLGDRLDQIPRLDPRVLLGVAADEGRALEHRVVELAS